MTTLSYFLSPITFFLEIPFSNYNSAVVEQAPRDHLLHQPPSHGGGEGQVRRVCLRQGSYQMISALETGSPYFFIIFLKNFLKKEQKIWQIYTWRKKSLNVCQQTSQDS